MKRIFLAIIILLSAGIIINAQEAKKEKSKADFIADLASDKDEKTIGEAADWVGKEKDKDAIPNLINLLSDRRESVRVDAAAALGYIGEESAVDALNKTLLNDESPVVRYAAVLASVRIGSKKSIDAFKQSFEQETDPFIKDFMQKYYEKVKNQ